MFLRSRTSRLLNRAVKITKRGLFLQTQTTPNESALKFLPSIQILPTDDTVEFLSGREAHKSPLALKLFSTDGIKSVMFGKDFITIEKGENEQWPVLKPEIFSILTEFLSSGQPVLDSDHKLPSDTAFDEDDDEVVAMIKELIFTRIRPAIQEDGGDLEFVRFDPDTGIVSLRLRGACRTCSSSSVTLKNGIESMLKHYIEEITAVEQIEDELVEEAIKENDTLARNSDEIPPSL